MQGTHRGRHLFREVPIEIRRQGASRAVQPGFSDAADHPVPLHGRPARSGSGWGRDGAQPYRHRLYLCPVPLPPSSVHPRRRVSPLFEDIHPARSAEGSGNRSLVPTDPHLGLPRDLRPHPAIAAAPTNPTITAIPRVASIASIASNDPSIHRLASRDIQQARTPPGAVAQKGAITPVAPIPNDAPSPSVAATAPRPPLVPARPGGGQSQTRGHSHRSNLGSHGSNVANE